MPPPPATAAGAFPLPFPRRLGTSCASLSILLLCAQIVRHDRKSLSHAAAALDAAAAPAAPCALCFFFGQIKQKSRFGTDRHTHSHLSMLAIANRISHLNAYGVPSACVIIVIDIAYTQRAPESQPQLG